MKDFAKSIVCNTKAKAAKTGNSYNWEERRGHQELYDPTVPFGGHVRGYVEKTKNGYVGAKTNGSILIAKKEFATEAEAKKFVENKQTGNTKVENIKPGDTGYVWRGIPREKYKVKILKVDDGWARFVFINGEFKGQEDEELISQIKAGNKKVGNANTHLTASNSGELWLNFDGTGEMYDPIELGRYDFSGKSEALSVARELEQLKRKAEQKVKDADKFINAIKQWAAGLK